MARDDVNSILRCPTDRTPLTPAGHDLVQRINAAIDAGHLVNQSGQIVETPIDGGLVRAAGDLMYPIVNQIPILLSSDAIPLEQLDGTT